MGAPSSLARGVLLFGVTPTGHQKQSVYPCRTMQSAAKLATRFVAGLLRHSAATASVTKSVG